LPHSPHCCPQIVRYALAPVYPLTGLFPLTVNLLRIQLVSAVLFGLGGLIVGILNAHQYSSSQR